MPDPILGTKMHIAYMKAAEPAMQAAQKLADAGFEYAGFDYSTPHPQFLFAGAVVGENEGRRLIVVRHNPDPSRETAWEIIGVTAGRYIGELCTSDDWVCSAQDYSEGKFPITVDNFRCVKSQWPTRGMPATDLRAYNLTVLIPA